jgi:hypothetical protein
VAGNERLKISHISLLEGRHDSMNMELLAKTENGESTMDKIAYRKPDLVVLGSVVEMTCGTLIKGHRGMIEAFQWRILPAYDLDA